MLTKRDLLAIKNMFDGRFDSIDKKFDSIDKRFDRLESKVDKNSQLIENNTKDLMDLILAGFKTHEPKLADHERRITRLEASAFSGN